MKRQRDSFLLDAGATWTPTTIADLFIAVGGGCHDPEGDGFWIENLRKAANDLVFSMPTSGSRATPHVALDAIPRMMNSLRSVSAQIPRQIVLGEDAARLDIEFIGAGRFVLSSDATDKAIRVDVECESFYRRIAVITSSIAILAADRSGWTAHLDTLEKLTSSFSDNKGATGGDAGTIALSYKPRPLYQRDSIAAMFLGMANLHVRNIPAADYNTIVDTLEKVTRCLEQAQYLALHSELETQYLRLVSELNKVTDRLEEPHDFELQTNGEMIRFVITRRLGGEMSLISGGWRAPIQVQLRGLDETTTVTTLALGLRCAALHHEEEHARGFFSRLRRIARKQSAESLIVR